MKTIVLILLLTGLLASRPLPLISSLDAGPITNPCKTILGKDRPYPCEFQIETIFFMGKNNEVLAKSTANSQTVTLPKSKAVINTPSGQGGYLTYKVAVDFKRINKASFPTNTYTLSEATLSTTPISPGETTDVNTSIKVSPNLPSSDFIRPNRVMFDLQLTYSGTGNNAILVAPILQLLMFQNPATYAKLSGLQQYRDRSEAWRTMQVSVNFTK
jgi:hypothetical protein